MNKPIITALLITLFLMGKVLNALNVYVTEDKTQADVKVYVSDRINGWVFGGLDPEDTYQELLVDAIVYQSPADIIPDHGCLLIWRFVYSYSRSNTKKIYLCNNPKDADISVYFSKKQSAIKTFNDKMAKLFK